MNATQAIERSISHNEIVTIESTPEVLDQLLIECDDHVDAGERIEFWGTDDGKEWRVHARGPIYWVHDAGQRAPLSARSEEAARAEIARSSDWTETLCVSVRGLYGDFSVDISA